MKKKLLFLMLSVLTLGAWADSKQLTISSGFNADLVAEATPIQDHLVLGIDGPKSGFYVSGVEGHSTGGFPENGNVVTNDGTTFEIDYAEKHALRLSAETTSGTLTLATPAFCENIYLLGAAGGGADNNVSVVVNYTDGTSSASQNITLPDWSNGTGTVAVDGLNRYRDSGEWEQWNQVQYKFKLFSVSFSVESSKSIQSLTFTRNAGTPFIMGIAASAVIPVEYIATTISMKDGDSNANVPYLNTGYIHTASTKIEMECTITANEKNWEALFGTRNGDGKTHDGAFVFFWRTGGNNVGCYNRGNGETTGSNTIPTNERIKVLANPDGITIKKVSDNSNVTTISTSSASVGNSNKPIYIFDTNTTNQSGLHPDGSRSYMKLYRFKIYEGDNLVRDYVPALQGSIPGLYDLKEGGFLSSVTTKAFDYGSEKAAVAAGDYYLYNVGSRKWLQDNSEATITSDTRSGWNTAANIGSYGRRFTLEADGTDWKINTHANNKRMGGGTADGSRLYLDAEIDNNSWTITGNNVDGYVFTSGGGKVLGVNSGQLVNNATGDNAKWKLYTREERLAELSEASAESPQDVSWLLVNPALMNNDSETPQWTINRTGGSQNWKDDYHPNRVFEAWSYSGFDFYQTVTVPNGKYRVKTYTSYSPTGKDGLGSTDYDDYVSNGANSVFAELYANSETAKVASIYSFTKASSTNDVATKEVGSNKYIAAGFKQIARDMHEENAFGSEYVNVTVDNGSLRVGVRRVDDAPSSNWIVIGRFVLESLGDINYYRNELDEAIATAEAFDDSSLTTDALWNSLQTALTAARNTSSTSTNADDMESAKAALNSTLTSAQAVDVSLWRETAALADAEGVSYTAANVKFSVATTQDEVDEALFDLRTARKINAQRQPDIYTGVASPAADTEYYLYNVGTGMWLTNASDWNSHAAVGMYGIVVTLTSSNGKWVMNTPFGKLNWNAYTDTSYSDTWTFNAVAGKTNVFTINSEGDRVDVGRLLGYDPYGHTELSGIHFWNNVAKDRENVNNPNNQWKLVTKEERDAKVAAATIDNPVDASYKITNPALSRKPGLDNWSKSHTGGNNAYNKHIATQEGASFDRSDDYAYAFKDFQTHIISQELTGLPNGLYEVGVQGFFRQGSSSNQANIVNNDQMLNSKSYLFAYPGTGYSYASHWSSTSKQLLPNIATECGKIPGIATQETNSGAFVNEDPFEAMQAFQTGLYKTTVQVIVTDGNLTLGVQQPLDAGGGYENSWVVVDNFQLTYLGAPITLSENATVNPNINTSTYKVTLDRTLKADKWNTFCVPFAMDKSLLGASAEVKELKSATNDGNGNYTMTFDDASSIEAGKPYMVKVADGQYSGTIEIENASGIAVNTTGSPSVTKDGVTFTGVYTNGFAPLNSFIISNNVFYLVDTDTNTDGVSEVALKAFRGYITVAGSNDVKALNFTFDDDDATSIQTIDNGQQTTDGAIYNVAGQRLNKMQKGINIVNGKKILR